MSITSVIHDIIKDLPLSSVLREKLLVAEARIAAIEKENMELKEKCAKYAKRIDEFEKELVAKQRAEENFVEYDGFLFRKGDDGEYIKAVFCPECFRIMSAWMGDFRYECGNCSIEAPFFERELPRVLEEIKKRFG